ncbi:MAG: carbonic anhydrase, partial [Bryobacteraceae bacterium]
NILAQIRNLETHPSVAARLRKGTLKVHGWMYDIEMGQVSTYSESEKRFVPLSQMHQTDQGQLAMAAAGEHDHSLHS